MFHVKIFLIKIKIITEYQGHQDFIYSMKSALNWSLVLSGSGNGMLLVHDVFTGDLLYGLGEAWQAATVATV